MNNVQYIAFLFRPSSGKRYQALPVYSCSEVGELGNEAIFVDIQAANTHMHKSPVEAYATRIKNLGW